MPFRARGRRFYSAITGAGGDVPAPTLRVRFNNAANETRLFTFIRRTAWVVGLSAIHYFLYTYDTLEEGGDFLGNPAWHITGNKRLVDWYFQHIGQTKTGFTMCLQYQLKLSEHAQKLTPDELVTEVARHVFSSWAYAPERWWRGREEPLDCISVEQIMRSPFRPPAHFAEEGDVEHAPPQHAGARFADAPDKDEVVRLVDAVAEKKGTPIDDEQRKMVVDMILSEVRGENGDVVNGQFVYRRDGEVRPEMHGKTGQATADETGHRSILLAPDPHEGTCWVLSVSPIRHFCVVRLMKAVSEDSYYFPKDGHRGSLIRMIGYRWRLRYMLAASGRKMERNWKHGQPKHFTDPPYAPRKTMDAMERELASLRGTTTNVAKAAVA